MSKPIEEQNLSVPFFVLSIVFLATILYMVYDEAIVRRPWKGYQEEFYETQVAKIGKDLEAAEKDLAEKTSASEGAGRIPPLSPCPPPKRSLSTSSRDVLTLPVWLGPEAIGSSPHFDTDSLPLGDTAPGRPAFAGRSHDGRTGRSVRKLSSCDVPSIRDRPR